jgi:hypothetical protein
VIPRNGEEVFFSEEELAASSICIDRRESGDVEFETLNADASSAVDVIAAYQLNIEKKYVEIKNFVNIYYLNIINCSNMYQKKKKKARLCTGHGHRHRQRHLRQKIKSRKLTQRSDDSAARTS